MKFLKKLFYKFFDYKIVGEYYDSIVKNGVRTSVKKYERKYFLRCFAERK